MKIKDWVKSIFGNNKNITLSATTVQNIKNAVYYYYLAIDIAKSIIGNAVANCDFKFYSNGNLDEKSFNAYKWNFKPNINQSGFEFKKEIIAKLIEDNEVLIFDNGSLNPDMYQIYIADSFRKNEHLGFEEVTFENVQYNSNILQRTLKRSECVYLKLNTENIIDSLSSVSSSLAEVLSFAIAGYKNSNSNKFKYKIEGMSVEDDNFQEKITSIKNEQLRPFLESINAVFPEFEGNDLVKFDNDDNKTANGIIDIRKDIFSAVAQTFNIPLNILLGGKVDDDMRIQFINDCVKPFLKMISTELNGILFTSQEFSNGNKVEIDTTAISLTMIVKLAAASEKIISSGLMNIDEVRTNVLQLPALNTDFSKKYWITKNFSEINDALKGGDGE